MKKFVLLTILAISLTSCVSVRFPEEIKINVAFPENMTEEHITKIIDKIQPNLRKRNVKACVVISNDGTKVHEETKDETLSKEN